MHALYKLARYRILFERVEQETSGRRKYNLLTKATRLAQQQRYARRVDHVGIADVDDVGNKDGIPLPILHQHKTLPLVPHFI